MYGVEVLGVPMAVLRVLCTGHVARNRNCDPTHMIRGTNALKSMVIYTSINLAVAPLCVRIL